MRQSEKEMHGYCERLNESLEKADMFVKVAPRNGYYGIDLYRKSTGSCIRNLTSADSYKETGTYLWLMALGAELSNTIS